MSSHGLAVFVRVLAVCGLIGVLVGGWARFTQSFTAPEHNAGLIGLIAGAALLFLAGVIYVADTWDTGQR